MVAGQTCQVEGCTRILKKTEGRICQMHRSRKFRHGNYDISPNWPNLRKGEPGITNYGYIRININGKRVLQHRYIMEQHLGRRLTKNERIHHINSDKTDNRIENLKMYSSNCEHMKKHHSDCWKQRTVNSEVPPGIIHQIVDRVHMDGGTFSTCFCNKPVMARNLCSRHYQWAYRHKLFRANRK